MPETVVVIPTYNECDNVVTLVPEVLRTIDCDVVIVDDDSPDGTGTVVRTLAERDPRIHLVNHRPRRGIGPAYKDGFRAALALEPDFVVQMDADFSHSPAMLPEMVRLAAENDLVLGSRYVRGITIVNWPLGRLLLSYFGNAYARRVTGMPIRDVRRYARLMKGGEGTNEQRLALLEAHREAVLAELEATARNLELIEYKINFYKERLGRT